MLRSGSKAALVLVTGVMLLVAACGSDDNTSSSTAAGSTTVGGTGATTAGTPTTAAGSGSAVTTAVGGSTATTTAAAAGTAGCPAIDSSIDAVNGKGAGAFESNLTCADAKPLAAAGDPIVIGMENPEGDPNGSFPEFSLAAQAAADYINKELGGLGADIQNGKSGRPVKLIVCKTAISPDDSQRCANELLAQKPVMALSTVNFFGNNIPIFTAGKVPVLVIAPITVADYTSPGTYAIAGGGGVWAASPGWATSSPTT
jgi:branched-chain amino acid transport system substrate-binding protein